MLVPLEVVADHSGVDQEQCPGVMRMQGVRVVREVPTAAPRSRRGRSDAQALTVGDGCTSGTSKTASLESVSDDEAVNDALTPPFDTKVAFLVRDNLETWQRLNVTAFLASGITAANAQLVGEPFLNAPTGSSTCLCWGFPCSSSRARRRARQPRGSVRSAATSVAVYTHDMFRTGHDAANRAVVRSVSGANLDLVGLAVHGPKNTVDNSQGCTPTSVNLHLRVRASVTGR